MRSFKSILFITLLLSSCGTPSVPPLAQIDGVTPETLEPGDVLHIHGSGFVEGEVEIVVSGVFKPLGNGRKEKRTLKLKGIAVSETDIELSLPPRTMMLLAAEPLTFDGSITTNFRLASDVVRIFAMRDNVHLELMPGGGGVAAHARKVRNAESHLSTVGIRPAAAKDVDGLVVAEVAAGSTADRAGVEFGDRVLAVDDRAVTGVEDMADISPHRSHIIDIITRQGLMKKVVLAPVSAAVLNNDELTAVMLSSIALGLFLALVAPSSRRRIPLPIQKVDPLTALVGMVLISLVLCLIPATALFMYNGALFWVFLFGCHAVCTIALFLRSPVRKTASLLKPAAIPSLAAVAAYLSSAVSPREIVAAQQSLTLGPHLLTSPLALLLGTATLFMMRSTDETNVKNPTSLFLTWMSDVSLAATVTMCLLGGWRIPFVSLESTKILHAIPALYCLSFLAKTWLVLAAAEKVNAVRTKERRTAPSRADGYIAPLVLIMLGGMTLLFEILPVPDTLRGASRILAAAMLLVFTSGLLGTTAKSFFRHSEFKKKPKRNFSPIPDSVPQGLHRQPEG